MTQPEIHRIDPVTIQDFGDKQGLKIVIRERGPRFVQRGSHRFYARFEHVDVRDGAMLHSVSGDGDTPQAALENYCVQIAGRRLVHDALGSNRREFFAPDKLEAALLSEK